MSDNATLSSIVSHFYKQFMSDNATLPQVLLSHFSLCFYRGY
jgi:hypothetical protein